MDFAHSEPSFQAERIHDLPQGQLGAGPEGARPAARQELHEAEGAAPRRPARALASLPGRSEAEHPGAAGGEIWAGHHERSLTGEKQRKSWGPATREPRGRRGNSRFLQHGNTLRRRRGATSDLPPDGGMCPGTRHSRACLPPLRREPCLGRAVPATVPGGQIPGTRDSRAKSPALVSLQGP